MIPIWLIVLAVVGTVIAVVLTIIFSSDPEGRGSEYALPAFAGAAAFALFAVTATAYDLWRHFSP